MRAFVITCRSRSAGRASIKLASSDEIAPGTVSLRLSAEGVLVVCGRTATVESAELLDDTNGLAIALRDGDLEIAVGRGEERANDSADAGTPVGLLEPPLAAQGRAGNAGQAFRDATLGAASAPAQSPHIRFRAHSQPAIDARVIPEAEWQPEDPGDTPTRFGRVGEGLEDVGEPRRERPTVPPAKKAAPTLRIRPGVRRIALLAMLASAFMLWLHAFRARASHPPARPPTAAASVVSAAPGGAAPGGHGPAPRPSAAAPEAADVPRPTERPTDRPTDPTTPPAPVVLPPPIDPSGAGLSRPPESSVAPPPLSRSAVSRFPATTVARRAADALANGAYAEARTLYEELASQPGADPVYAYMVRSIDARAAESPPRAP
jgi:hypothetical protein